MRTKAFVAPSTYWTLLALCLLFLAVRCSRTGRLQGVQPVVPTATETSADSASAEQEQTFAALFGDTLLPFAPGSGDSSIRYLGRLSSGFTIDTLNFVIFGDNRPGWATSRLRPQYKAIQGIASLSPVRWVKGLVNIPIFLFKGTVPDLVLWRELPSIVKGAPNYGREHQVHEAVRTLADTLKARNQPIVAIINTGDLVKDGRIPAQWNRFLDIVKPLATEIPYFPIAGNHERTDTPDGLYNWHAATGLPITGDRLYYFFDSADGWVRFVALDSNPMTDPANHWSREVEVKYSDEQIDWLTKILKDHVGPVVVFMHHPPFSLGFHRVEWEADDMLRERRGRLVKTLQDHGLSVIATGHEHAYERALLTCGDDVLIYLVTGGAGSPLHDIPPGPEAAAMFASYQVDGCEFKPENVFVNMAFHFVHVKIWFGGGEFFTYAVDDQARMTLIDEVKVDFKRYGIPKIDQFKMPIPSEGPKQPPPTEESPKASAAEKKAIETHADTTASERTLTKPPPTPPKKNQ